MDIQVNRDSNFNAFILDVVGGKNNEKIITIKCNMALKGVVCGQEVIAYPGSVISFTI